MGPPGSGKGTLSALCKEQFGWNQVSTGNLCRSHIQIGTETGKKIKVAIDKGQLISDEIVAEMLQEWMISQKNKKQNVIFDGYPRTKKQAELLYDMVQSNLKEYDIELVRFLVDKEILLERILARVICSNKDCQRAYSLKDDSLKTAMKCDICESLLVKRSDDTLDTLMNRIDTYYQYEQDIVDFYMDHGVSIVEINAACPIQDVFQNFTKMVEQE